MLDSINPAMNDANPAKKSRRSLREQIAEDIACVFQRDPAARTRFEVITTYPGLHAILLYRIANRLWRRGWKYPPRLLSYIGRIWTSVDIHPGATIGSRFFIDHGTGVVIGETAEIGNDVTIYHGVTLGGVSWNKGKRHPTLCDEVVVGAGAKILGPITIGRAARIGANSVVVSPVPEGKSVVGIPGRVVQTRGPARTDDDRLDLNHHWISDPVAEAITCLLDRIRILEKNVGVYGCISGGVEPEDECEDCYAKMFKESLQEHADEVL